MSAKSTPHRLSLAFLLVTLVGLLSACAASAADSPRPGDGPIQVVTTIGQITDIAQIVGGDRVAVTGLMGAGVDPHLYVASEGDVELLQNAEIIFYNGLFLEAQMAEILEQLGRRKTVTAVAEAIPEELLLPWAAYEDAYDPHVWFDVTLWMKAVEAVRDTYAAYDPEHAAEYEARAAAYLQELAALHQEILDKVAQLPPERRVLITAHDAFHYFGRAYGFEVRGLQGISTASEASTADVRALANFIVERQIPAIFVESSVPVRNIEALQAAVAAQGFQVQIGGELFSDALGDPGTPEGTYIGMVRHNVDTIVNALLGQS
ncbi:zinc ABC transporter substrate-binding protein [Litorilinea aerophila]|uniref:Manganese transporter n=1 Tax=Litorilinea aerophila TaxID=1204385 RepID=A0A540VCH4_9CHLR|nr:zinc ABC transporter substrate-binding protein [Litorilinea aerophila]MCC9078393.1 zinc ABC transporter substrate-binding protein [Litorilinea aerophila]OUC09011.1 manganese transporter [Litorilinea aerophila]